MACQKFLLTCNMATTSWSKWSCHCGIGIGIACRLIADGGLKMLNAHLAQFIGSECQSQQRIYL